MEYTKVLKVGDKVPEFELESFNPVTKAFETVRLSDMTNAGKWTVLFFYPADYTFICPTELADLADKQDAFESAGAQIISVSTDTKFVHLAWQREEKLLANVEYQMASDPTATVSRIFGVYNEANGLNLRGTFIISPDGTLAAAEVNYYNVGRSAEELLRKVEANAYLTKNPNEVCPANWRTGGKTLRPGENLVGRVAATLNS